MRADRVGGTEKSAVQVSMCAGTCRPQSRLSHARIVDDNRAPKKRGWIPEKNQTFPGEKRGYIMVDGTMWLCDIRRNMEKGAMWTRQFTMFGACSRLIYVSWTAVTWIVLLCICKISFGQNMLLCGTPMLYLRRGKDGAPHLLRGVVGRNGGAHITRDWQYFCCDSCLLCLRMISG
jgi:hypothetical protein